MIDLLIHSFIGVWTSLSAKTDQEIGMNGSQYLLMKYSLACNIFNRRSCVFVHLSGRLLVGVVYCGSGGCVSGDDGGGAAKIPDKLTA